MKKCAAEFVGTLVLTVAVSLAILYELPLSVPVIAALTLGLFVYTVGPVSGAHLNPAVTIGLWSVRKISDADAARYVAAQVLGALGALFLVKLLVGHPLAVGVEDTVLVGVVEAAGAFLLTFGVSAVAYGKAAEEASGLIVGGSLLLGALFASVEGNGVVNPAVAVGIGSLSLMYIIGPLIGGVLAAQLYNALAAKK